MNSIAQQHQDSQTQKHTNGDVSTDTHAVDENDNEWDWLINMMVYGLWLWIRVEARLASRRKNG